MWSKSRLKYGGRNCKVLHDSLRSERETKEGYTVAFLHLSCHCSCLMGRLSDTLGVDNIGVAAIHFLITKDGFLRQFPLSSRQKPDWTLFVSLNNSDSFIYFKFSLVLLRLFFFLPSNLCISVTLVALRIPPHHSYMYKDSSRDSLLPASAIAQCSQWDVKRILSCAGLGLVQFFFSLTQCVEIGWDVNICGVWSFF